MIKDRFSKIRHSRPVPPVARRSRALLWSAAALALIVITSAAFWFFRPKPTSPASSPYPIGYTAPPIVLVSIDTLRADYLSCYGNRGPGTPHIDTMTKGGTLFSQVSAQTPLTLPSHVSFLTSTYPFSNGIEDNGQQLGPSAVTLAEVLKSRGYRTASFVGGFVMDRRFGLDQGFDVYDSPFDPSRQIEVDPEDLKRLGEDVVQAAIRWLTKNGDEPFFLFLHLFDLHTPYNLPPSVQTRFPGPGYDAELSYVDEMLGRFWEFLAERGLLERALIVFTADHGESLGEHGEKTHGYFIYQSTLWVPLIIHWPAGAGPFPAKVEEPISLLGVAPTILHFAGIPQPSEFQGQSLLGLLNQESPSTSEEVYSESLYARDHFGCSALRCLRLGRYKYIEAPQPELYDLAQDPGELHNLYSEQQAMALDYRQRLSSLRSRFHSQQQARSKPPSPEVIARLRSLGYLAGSSPRPVTPEAGPDPKDRIVEYGNYRRAIGLALSGQLKQSNALLERVVAKDPDLLDVRNVLGSNQQKLGQHAEAVKTYRQVLEKDPLNVLAHFNLGVSYSKLNRLDDAIKELQAALAAASTSGRALEQVTAPAEELLGTIWLQRKDYERARLHFEQLLKIAPSSFVAHYNLAWLATREERLDEGVRHLHAALQADPQNAAAHNALGGLYLRQGDLDEAKARFSEAIRLEPKLAWAHYNLGLVLSQKGSRDAAARQFRQALAVEPRFRPARDALKYLRQTQ